LNELPNLFFERHLAKQMLHASLDLWIGELDVGWMLNSIRILRRGRRDCLCRGIRFQSSQSQAERGASEDGADARIHPETSDDHDVDINSIATYRIHSQHKISPRHNLWNVHHLQAGVQCLKNTMVLVQFRRANGLRDGLVQEVNDGSAIVCALNIF
jgi:hypothetical protein